MVKTSCILLLSIVVYSTAFAGEPSNNLSIDSLKKFISVLAEDSLQGRATGTKGGYLAADFISSRLKAYSLEPITGDSYLQQIPFISTLPQAQSELDLIFPGKTRQLALGSDYAVYSSGTETYVPIPTDLVFAGYGIVAPEYDYNDYQSINVEGKIVVYISGEPNSDDKNYFLGNVNTLYSSPETKQKIALSRGAIGTIMLFDPDDKYYKGWDYYNTQYEFEEVSLAYKRSISFSLLVNPDLNNLLFSASGYNAAQIIAMIYSHSIRSFPLNIKMTFKPKSINRNFIANNIIAIKRGKDPELKDSYVLLSAHYDHLGVGKPVNGDSIYNGLVDNASGTSALLEIARAFTKVDTKRSIIFLFTTAEEKGLLGASYYTDNPSVPLYKTICNINIDGLNFIDSTNSMVIVGSEYSNIAALLEPVLNSFNYNEGYIPELFNAEDSYANSDQFAFAKGGIPSVIIAEGIEYRSIKREEGLNKLINWLASVYHTPFDDKNQVVNYYAMYQHAEFIFACAKYIANSEEVPEWNKGSPFVNAQLNSIAEKK